MCKMSHLVSEYCQGVLIDPVQVQSSRSSLLLRIVLQHLSRYLDHFLNPVYNSYELHGFIKMTTCRD